MKIFSFLFLLLVIPIQISAQVTQEWVAFYNSVNQLEDRASDIALDSEGNVFVTGTVYSGTPSDFDFTTIKYNSSGEEQWVKIFNGPGSNRDEAVSLALDNNGNVYVTGSIFNGEINKNDFATIKYNSDGDLQWIQQYNSGGNDDPVVIKVDADGNIYVTGTITADPSNFNSDWVTIKYNSSGLEQWVKIYNNNGLSNSNDIAADLAVDNSGNVYVTGESENEAGQNVYATIKYDSNGNEGWISRYRDINRDGCIPVSIAVDNLGNVYVTGSVFIATRNIEGINFADFATVKYNSSGVEQWVQKSDDLIQEISAYYAKDLEIDQNGNIFVTGSRQTQTSSIDFATIKYNPDGVNEWVQIFNSPGNDWDDPNSIVVDNEGSVYVTGSTGIGSNSDYTTIKYNAEGETKWVQIFNGLTNSQDAPNSIVADNNGSVYVTGYSYSTNSGYDYATIKYSQPQPLQITKPTPYSKFIAGETDTIKWTDAGWAAVNIKCITNFETPLESELILAQGIPNVNSKFVWNLPDATLSFRSKIIIENADNPTEKIESDIFRIKPYLLTRLNSDSTYYEYRKNRDQFNVVNDSTQMWPNSWYSQFNYQGVDPFTYLNLSYSQTQLGGVFALSQNHNYPDWISWVNAFSPDTLYKNRLLGIYKNRGTLKWQAEKTVFFGSCHGIALANALVFAHRNEFVTRFPNFTQFNYPIEVTSDNNFKKVIIELFSHQYGNPTRQNRVNKWNTSPNSFLNEVREMLKEDNCNPRTVFFANNNGGGAHIVNVYGLRKDPVSPGIYYIDIYDNSIPNSNNPITINTQANGGNGTWNTPDWINQLSGLPFGGNKWIMLDIPADSSLLLPVLPDSDQSLFEMDNSKIEINNKYSYDISISDEFGNKTGFVDDSLIYEISDSYPLTAATGSITPPYGYLLPNNQYSISLNNFIEEFVETFFFTSNKAFAYERNSAALTQIDRLFFDGGVSVTNPDAQSKTIKLLNLISETTQEKLFVARSLEIAQNDSVKIENPDSNKVKLISYGTAKSYDLELNYVTENELGRFVASDVSLSANTSHTFVPVWADITNTELQVLVDIGNDGTIDDTLSLINQVTGIGEDQGSLLTPNSYNLAQNYPNPFNPTTKISWQSPIGSHQTLKIYDVLGNEVATLVDEFRNAGRYEVTFDASNLSSGIYFYRLQVGSFVETKKMILLR